MLHWEKFEKFLHDRFSDDRRLGEYFVSEFDDVVSFAKASQSDFLGTDEEIKIKAEKSLNVAGAINWAFKVALRCDQGDFDQSSFDKQNRDTSCMSRLLNAFLELYLVAFSIRFKNLLDKRVSDNLIQAQFAFLLGKIESLSDILVSVLGVSQEAIVVVEEIAIQESRYASWSNLSEDDVLEAMGDGCLDDVFEVLSSAVLDNIIKMPDIELLSTNIAFSDSRCSEDMGLVDDKCDHEYAWNVVKTALAARSARTASL
jgi:hypothetical protein